MILLKKMLQNILLKLTGYRLINNFYYNNLVKISDSNSYEFLTLCRHFDFKSLNIELFNQSKSQILQDIFVLFTLNFKKNGFFVEFGATNGITLSNTFLLEKEFDWKGILAEPARLYHEELKKNRNCVIEKKCLYSVSKKSVVFSEQEIR